MSGVLAPTFSQSEVDGTQLNLPVYWNQAENYDMTFTPVFYSNRGLQLNTENRYLFTKQSGQLDLSWLDDDINNQQRWFRKWQHEAETGGLHSSLLIQKVSDSNFLQDFDHLENIKDEDFLKSAISFSANLYHWSSEILFEQHQTVNQAKSPPYKRLPRITLDRVFTSADTTLTVNWKNEWVRFDKEDSITGDRLHISPIISYPVEDTFYYITPALQLDYTHYSLNSNIDEINSIERSLPLLNLDSGLIFERVASSKNSWTQTLEPRLYFLYVPFEEQTNIPGFDSSLLAENYDSLFVNNRFSGSDRVGDTKQVSLGITTRLLDDSSQQFFSASIGQAFYAEERKVSLTNTIDDREKSSLMTVIKYTPEPTWDIQLASVYDQLEKESNQSDISIRHNTAEQVFNIEYHFRQDQLEQSTLSFVYPVTHNWTVYAKQQMSILHDKPVQNLFGLAYQSCCWGFKALYEESSDKEFEETDRAVYFQLTFKGLSSAGRDINSLLKDGILGFQPEF